LQPRKVFSREELASALARVHDVCRETAEGGGGGCH
jgi:hypothetical protein